MIAVATIPEGDLWVLLHLLESSYSVLHFANGLYLTSKHCLFSLIDEDTMEMPMPSCFKSTWISLSQ